MINKLSIFAFAALLTAGAWATHGTWETELDFTALVQLATEATGPMDPDFSLHGMIQSWERAPGSSMGFAMPPDPLRAESFPSPGPLPFFVSASPGDTTADDAPAPSFGSGDARLEDHWAPPSTELGTATMLAARHPEIPSIPAPPAYEDFVSALVLPGPAATPRSGTGLSSMKSVVGAPASLPSSPLAVSSVVPSRFSLAAALPHHPRRALPPCVVPPKRSAAIARDVAAPPATARLQPSSTATPLSASRALVAPRPAAHRNTSDLLKTAQPHAIATFAPIQPSKRYAKASSSSVSALPSPASIDSLAETTAAPPQATTPRPHSRKALLSAVRATPRAEILPSAGTLGYGAIYAADANGGAWYYVNDVTPETYPSYYPQPPAGPFSDQLFILDAANNYSMTFSAKVLGYDFAAGVTPIVDLAFAVDGHYDESSWTIYRNPISPAGEQSDGKFLWEINGLTKDLSEWLDGKEHTLDVFFILSDQNSSDDESFNRYWYGSDGDSDSEGRYGPIASARFTSNAAPVIPEPATTSLLALGAFVALLRRRARR